MEAETNVGSDRVYAVVNNIPSSYRSADLRRFFSQFVETKGFDCFHFRHRPEKQSVKKSITTSSEESCSKDDVLKTFCCIIRLTDVKFTELLRTYHQRKWKDSKGDSMSSKCLISRLKTSLKLPLEGNEMSKTTDEKATATTSNSSANKYVTRGDLKRIPPDREEFKEEDLLKLPELRPPTVMPHGNVGTPTMHFMKLIQECRLPPSIIKKLQLDFPKSKDKGKYGNVPFDYQTEVTGAIVCDDGDDIDAKANEPDADSVREVVNVTDCEQQTPSDSVTISNSKSLETQNREPDYKEKRRLKKLAKQERKMLMAERIEEKMIEFERAGSESGEDNDTCEEWERHEAMYDDVTNQGRNKDRLFEEEMEVVWEKGGSGLVFYTDAQYWQEKEGDFDEQTADDLDVDMSAYYEDGAGDPDIRDFLKIRQEQRRRRGIDQTDRFTAGIGKFKLSSTLEALEGRSWRSKAGRKGLDSGLLWRGLLTLWTMRASVLEIRLGWVIEVKNF